MVQIVSSVRTSENKTYRQGIGDPKELANGFPTRAEDLFGYQGLIIGSVEAGSFTPVQQELIHDFVDRRGGGLLLLDGQYALADGGWNTSKIVDLLPTTLPTQPGTFHREADPRAGTTHTTVELALLVPTAWSRDSPMIQRRMPPSGRRLPYLMDYEDPGTAKPGATVLAEYDYAGWPQAASVDHGKFRPWPQRDHGGQHLALADEPSAWATRLTICSGSNLLRWVVTDTPGHLTCVCAVANPGSTMATVMLTGGSSRCAIQSRARCARSRRISTGPRRRRRASRDVAGAGKSGASFKHRGPRRKRARI